MDFKTQLNSILNKKMNRQDFIKNSAIGLVALTGVGAALRLMQPTRQNQQSSGGYGSSAYGGESITKKTS